MTDDKKHVINVASRKNETVLDDLNTLMIGLNCDGTCFHRMATDYDGADAQKLFEGFYEKLQTVGDAVQKGLKTFERPRTKFRELEIEENRPLGR